MEHYFPLKIPLISNTTTSFNPKKQPRGTDGPVQQSDVTAAPRAHTSDVTFSKF